MEIFEIAVRRQAKESQDAIELRARIGSRESVEGVINELDDIIYTHLGVRRPPVPADFPNAEEIKHFNLSPAQAVEAKITGLIPTREHREAIVVGTPTEEEVQDTAEATERAVKAKRGRPRKKPADDVVAEAVEQVADKFLAVAVDPTDPLAVAIEAAEETDAEIDRITAVADTAVAPAACMVDFDLLAMDDEPAPQPAVVNVAKLKVPEVKYEEPKAVAPAANASAPEVTDPLKLQKRIQDAIASRVISPEPVLSLMHARGFNSTRETDEACRIAILELIIAAEAKK